jgi:predicted ATP-grasp superfamily ATP-dependent carboligase
MYESRDETAVLVPGIDAPSTVACLRSLHPRGIRTIVGSESTKTPAAFSKYCDEFVRLPDPSDDLLAYGDALCSIARRSDVETIIPVREEDVYSLARNRNLLAGDVATPWPTFETLRRVQDRVELFEAADTAGVATPETTLLDEWEDWDREVIVKPRYTVAAPEYLGTEFESGEIGSTTYLSPGTPPSKAACLETMGHVPLVQECIADSREYGFFALYDRGDPVATFQHCQRRGWEYCGGPSAYRESVYIPELETAGRALLDELEWHGLAMVEFLRDSHTDEFKLMEINPRFWSSLPFTVQTGADFPLYYWQLAMDEPIPGRPTYQAGIGGHLLRGELSYVHSVLTEEYPLVERPPLATAVHDVATSLIRQPRFDYADPDDPMPFVRDSWNVVREWFGEWSAEPEERIPRSAEPEAAVEENRDTTGAPGSVTAE